MTSCLVLWGVCAGGVVLFLSLWRRAPGWPRLMLGASSLPSLVSLGSQLPSLVSLKTQLLHWSKRARDLPKPSKKGAPLFGIEMSIFFLVCFFLLCLCWYRGMLGLLFVNEVPFFGMENLQSCCWVSMLSSSWDQPVRPFWASTTSRCQQKESPQNPSLLGSQCAAACSTGSPAHEPIPPRAHGEPRLPAPDRHSSGCTQVTVRFERVDTSERKVQKCGLFVFFFFEAGFDNDVLAEVSVSISSPPESG